MPYANTINVTVNPGDFKTTINNFGFTDYSANGLLSTGEKYVTLNLFSTNRSYVDFSFGNYPSGIDSGMVSIYYPTGQKISI
jgi:hypothetical protein